MNVITLKEIQDICNSPEGLRKKKLVRDYVRSDVNFDPTRKRPRHFEEQIILNSFTRK